MKYKVKGIKGISFKYLLIDSSDGASDLVK